MRAKKPGSICIIHLTYPVTNEHGTDIHAWLTGQYHPGHIIDTYDDFAEPGMITDLQRTRAAIEYLMWSADDRGYARAEVRDRDGATVWMGTLDTPSYEVIRDEVTI